MIKKVKNMAVVGVIMINIGLVLTCFDLRKEKENYYAELLEKTDAYEKLELILYAEIDERMRIQYQNERLYYRK